MPDTVTHQSTVREAAVAVVLNDSFATYLEQFGRERTADWLRHRLNMLERRQRIPGAEASDGDR